MTSTSAPSGTPSAGASLADIRNRNWIAIAIATFLMMFSYFTYGAAFVEGTGDAEGIEPRLVALGLALAPFVFIVLAFVSHNARAPRDVLRAMGLLLVCALGVALIDPLLGAAVGYTAGGACALRRPAVDGVVKWRVTAVCFTLVYILVLLVVIPPGGIFSGAVAPFVIVGLSDEFAAWSADRPDRPA